MHDHKHAIVVLPSAARTAATTATFNTACRGGIFIIDITAVSGAASLTFTIKGQDPASGKTYTILASAALVAVATTVLRVHVELTAAANTIAKDMLPQCVQVAVTVGTADSATYSVGFVGTN
jgi:hypothetical protein